MSATIRGTSEYQYMNHIDNIARSVEYLIAATPSGEVRNALTDINITLLRIKTSELEFVNK